MTSAIFEENKVMQVCFITDDLERSSAFFSELFDRQPHHVGKSASPETSQAVYKGEPSRTTCRLAIWKFDNIDVEILEPDSTPSAWRDYIEAHGPSIHHIAFRAKGMKDKTLRLAAKGVPLLQQGEFDGGGGRYAYFDTEKQLGALVELLEFDH